MSLVRQHAYVAIYLDANILRPWRTFTEPGRLALSIVAHQLGQAVLVPWVVVREVEEDHRRTLQAALDSLTRDQRELEGLFGIELDVHAEPWPDIDDALETWRRRLSEFATILPLDAHDAVGAFEREITGRRPATKRETNKPGRGGRDAAIWLTVVRDHMRGAEGGHFLSSDGDMSDANSQLHPEMQADIDGGHELRVYKNINAFLALLGTASLGRVATRDDLAGLDSGAIGEWLNNSIEIPKAIWMELEPRLEYSSVVTQARPLEILRQDRYAQADDAVIVVNARWELNVECCYRERATKDPLWGTVQGIKVTAEIQMFIEERDGAFQRPQVIGAQASSAESLFFGDEGGVVAIRPVRQDR